MLGGLNNTVKMLNTAHRTCMLATIIMKCITEKFPVRARVSNQAWRFDQEQCRKSVDQVGTGEGKMPGASEGRTWVTQGDGLV